jgi:hypothetical protein
MNTYIQSLFLCSAHSLSLLNRSVEILQRSTLPPLSINNMTECLKCSNKIPPPSAHAHLKCGLRALNSIHISDHLICPISTFHQFFTRTKDIISHSDISHCPSIHSQSGASHCCKTHTHTHGLRRGGFISDRNKDFPITVIHTLPPPHPSVLLGVLMSVGIGIFIN